MRISVISLFGVLLAGSGSYVGAGTVTIPTTFTSGTPAKAAEVNGNFAAVAGAVNGNAQDIAALKTAVQNMPVGPQGPVGSTGLTGPMGPVGPTGFPGAQGLTGANGATGATGSPGTAGTTGAQGLQGLQGVAGVQGLQGIQGLQGSQGATGPGAMIVKDSAGKLVGSYHYAVNPFAGANSVPDDNVFVRTGTLSFALHLTASQLGQPSTTVVYFTTASCTGTAYLTYSYSYEIGMPVVPYASVVGTTAYVGGTSHLNGTASSKLYFNGTQIICEQSMGGLFSGNYVPVVATFDLVTLNFVPPYSVQ